MRVGIERVQFQGSAGFAANRGATSGMGLPV